MRLRVGVLLNPVAGIGGSVALRGSDGLATQQRARTLGARSQAAARLGQALAAVNAPDRADWLTIAAPMGEDVLATSGIQCRVVGAPRDTVTTSQDSRESVHMLTQAGIDLLLFAGGDGTARDVLVSLNQPQLCLGVPAGVKMHSSVFALTPSAAGRIISRLLEGDLVAIQQGEVRDIDEAALREGRIDNHYFGSMRVPAAADFMQSLKIAGRESEPLAQEEVAAGVLATIQPGRCYLLGAGSTLFAIKRQLGFAGTLLGVDVWQDGQVLAVDATAQQLLAMCTAERDVVAVLSPTGHQGMLLGRGNQQFSPAVLRCLAGRLMVVATRGKLAQLQGRPMWVDSGDAQMDARLCGLVDVICGYDERLLYAVSTV